MSASTSSAAPNEQPSQKVWPSYAPYLVPPFAASFAIVPVFRDMIAKSALQRGMPVPKMTLLKGMQEGLKAAPTVGAIVGTQMVVQNAVEKTIVGESNNKSLPSMLASSAVVGAVSAPVLAVFNGQTMGWSVLESLRRFSAKQGLAIMGQETFFVLGMAAGDRLAPIAKRKFGNNKLVEYLTVFTSSAAGSLAGHSQNTALTRWQSGLLIDNWRQLTWGALRKARANGGFGMCYYFLTEVGKATMQKEKL